MILLSKEQVITLTKQLEGKELSLNGKILTLLTTLSYMIISGEDSTELLTFLRVIQNLKTEWMNSIT